MTALAWMLVHSLWIGLGTWVLINILSVFFAKSKNRRILKIGSLLLFVVLVLTTLFKEFANTTPTGGFWYVNTETLNLESSLSWLDHLKQWISLNSTLITSIWAMGTLIGAARYAYNRKALNRCQYSAIPCTHEDALHHLLRIRKALHIGRNISIKVSALVDSPMTVGFIKPIIYLPIGLISGFSSDELEIILRHELAHIKRHDYLVNLFLVMLETLFFFNPILLFLVRDLRREMEYVCDDEVLVTHNQFAYAKTLLKLQENSISYQVALAAQNNNSEFKNRVERMMNLNKPKTGSKASLIVFLFSTLLVSSAFVGNTESKDSPAPTPVSILQEVKQDTIKVKTREELNAKTKELGFDNMMNKVVLLNGERVLFVKDVNKTLQKADKMMEEVQRELVKDGILNESKQKITLMFQYSDVLHGEATLGDKYEKYKGILNRYFPTYDSFATTRVFRYKKS